MATTNESIIAWFNEQSIWLRDAVNTLYTNGEYTAKDITRFAEECIKEADGSIKDIDIDISSLNLLSKNDNRSLIIRSINNVKGVNALASGKSLEFGINGVTVVYGENGAGKSGYIRILKKLTGAKYQEELKGNVYALKNDKPSCCIDIVCSGQNNTLNCNLTQSGEYAELRNVDIFDTKISTAYISEANEASYEPWIFSLFSELAKVADLVKEEIEKKKNEQNSVEIEIPEEFTKTTTGIRLKDITFESSFGDDFFIWNEKDNELLKKKEQESNIETIKNNIERLENEVKYLTEIKEYIQGFEDFFSAESVTKINQAKHEWTKAETELKAAQVLFSEDASEIDKESIPNSAWKALWKDAKDYYETFLKEKGFNRYTEEQGVCPLCGQTISNSERVRRMRSVDEYVNGTVSQKVKSAKNAYWALLKACPQAWGAKQFKLALDACGIGSIEKNIQKCANEIADISNLIYSDTCSSIGINMIGVSSIIKDIEIKLKEKKNSQEATKKLLNDENYKKTIDEIYELKAKKWASTLKDKVKKRINYLCIAKCYNDAIKLVQTNKITKKSKELGKELLTDKFIGKFNDELKRLTKGMIRAELKPSKVSKGKIPFKIALEGVQDEKIKPIDVFSEGEKRVVSLAAFFAEASGRDVECPLIVDDPISSLDLKFESRVIDRLVEASKHRQVIVFTHRLSMVVGLHDKCEDTNILFTEKEIRGRGSDKGVPVDLEFTSLSVGKTLGRFKDLKNKNLVKAKKLDKNSDEYTEEVHYICQQIRNLVEKSIEDSLLNGIVRRYRNSIQTLHKLSWLAKITAEDCNIIDDMMTKYSYYDHSMADETPLQEFSIEEIEEDIDKMIGWLEDIKTRQKA